MKKEVIVLTFSSICATPEYAQSSVTLFGVIDESVDYSSIVAGNHNYELESGYARQSRWGLKARKIWAEE